MLRAGASEVDITPPVGMWLIGCQSASTGVNDPLMARVLCLDIGRETVVLVSLDLCGLSRADGFAIRRAVATACDTAPFRVLLLISHNHSAPFSIPWSMTGRRRFQIEGAQWMNRITLDIAEASRQAMRHMTDARLDYGRAQVQIGMNRRLDGPPPDTQAVMQPNPAGPVVPWSDALCFSQIGSTGPGAQIVLFSQAAHPVMIHYASTLISADYPFYAGRRLRDRLGTHVMPMFAQACGADNNAPWATGFERCRQSGEQLGDTIADLCPRMTPLDPVSARFESCSLDLPLKEFETEEQLEDAIALEETRLASVAEERDDDPWRWEDLLTTQEKLRMVRERRVPASMPFDIHMLTFGQDLAIVGLSDEVFAAYQLRIDEISPFKRTMVWAYCNSTENYIPADCEHRRGGYEIIGGPLRYPYHSGPAHGAESLIVGEVARMLDRAWSAAAR